MITIDHKTVTFCCTQMRRAVVSNRAFYVERRGGYLYVKRSPDSNHYEDYKYCPYCGEQFEAEVE